MGLILGSKKKIAADLKKWFNAGCLKVIVYQKLNSKTKIALYCMDEFDCNFFTGMGTLPYTSCPNDKWLNAPIVASVDTLNDALIAMDCSHFF
jgi:hypothetical protein